MDNMIVPLLTPESDYTFPPVEQAKPSGLLAVGGDLSPARLIRAYALGIFPWYSEGGPIMWWCPDPRCVLFPDELHVPSSLKRVINQNKFIITQNMAFATVINYCGQIPRPHQNGTWLQPEMIEAYIELHKMGYAHSVEAWENNQLVGGLYGMALGRIFFGESMFHLTANASKVAFVSLVKHLKKEGFNLIDCQQTTSHMLSMGAREISRPVFSQLVQDGLVIV